MLNIEQKQAIINQKIQNIEAEIYSAELDIKISEKLRDLQGKVSLQEKIKLLETARSVLEKESENGSTE